MHFNLKEIQFVALKSKISCLPLWNRLQMMPAEYFKSLLCLFRLMCLKPQSKTFDTSVLKFRESHQHEEWVPGRKVWECSESLRGVLCQREVTSRWQSDQSVPVWPDMRSSSSSTSCEIQEFCPPSCYLWLLVIPQSMTETAALMSLSFPECSWTQLWRNTWVKYPCWARSCQSRTNKITWLNFSPDWWVG